jgi:2-polyprenyl-6-methoxyphenol hydroxylase-like FAD-dependent oxidoreductase
MQTYDVIIIGAGAAGIATARALAKVSPGLAARTLLLEQQPAVAASLGGAWAPLTGASLRALDALDLGADMEGSALAEVAFEGSAQGGQGGSVVPLATPWRLVERGALFGRMFHQVACALEVRLGERVRALTHHSDWVRVETQARTYRAHVVIGADGARSVVRALTGLPPEAVAHKDDDLTTAAFADATVAPPTAPAPGTLRYDLSLAAAGERGLVWYAAEGRLGAGTHQVDATDSAHGQHAPPVRAHVGLIQHGLNAPAPDAALDASPDASPDASTARLRTWLTSRGWLDSAHLHDAPQRRQRYSDVMPLGASRLLLVGDAAGVAPLLDDGLWQCLEYGCFTAYALSDAFERRDFNLQRYGVALRAAALGHDLRESQRMCARLFGPDRAHWLRRLLTQRSALAALLVAHASGDTTLSAQRHRLLWMRLMTRLRGGQWV